MAHSATRHYSVTEIRQIVGLACDMSDLPSDHLLGMVCLADLLNHISAQGGEVSETKVRDYFATLPTRDLPAPDGLDD